MTAGATITRITPLAVTHPVPEPDLSAMTMDELVESGRVQYGLAEQAANDTLRHALATGHVLNEAASRMSSAEFEAWVVEKLSIKGGQARRLRRIANHEAEILEAGVSSLNGALQVVVGKPRSDTAAIADEVAQMRDLYDYGWSYRRLAEEYDVDEKTAWNRVNRESILASKAKYNAKKARLLQLEKRELRDRAMKKRGGSIAQAYSLIRKTAQELDRACSEMTDPDQRAEVTAALSALHSNVEDRIVRALGVE